LDVEGLLMTELCFIKPTNEREAASSSTEAPQSSKKPRVSMFDHYSTRQPSASDGQQLERQLTHYLDFINATTFDLGDSSSTMSTICLRSDFTALQPLFERVLCAPASSAPVERIFSQSGLIVRPHRSKLSDKILEALVFLKCNAKLGNGIE
jgi:hAT family C-terminal dimerisation region